MSLLSFSGLDALFNHRTQPYSYWKEAAERLRTGKLKPYHHHRFQLNSTDSLFAMGSCFARRIEQAFLRKNMNCTSAKGFADASNRIFGKLVNVNYTNKYSTHSMLNEIRWALDPSAKLPQGIVVDLNESTAIDLQAAPHLGELSLPTAGRAEVYDRHMQLLGNVTAQLKTADVFVMTLGLVELWYDHKTKLFTNAGLLAELLEREPKRFTFEVSSFNENMDNLEQIYALLKKHCKPSLKIIVTTSPVPMAATFSGRDIPIANCYSKSVLRAVAEEWKNKHDNIDYFPSYEMATLSNRDLVWEEDLIHVQDSFADVIIGQFSDSYLSPNAPTPLKRQAEDKPSLPRRGLNWIERRMSQWT